MPLSSLKTDLPLRQKAAPARRRLPSVVPAPGGASPQEQARGLARHLLAEGVIGAHALRQVARLALTAPDRLAQSLLSLGLASDPALTTALARHSGLDHADPVATPPDPALIDVLGAEACLRLGVLPWAVRDEATWVLVAEPALAARRQPMLNSVFGPVRFALAPRGRIEAAIALCRGDDLCRRAETLAPAGESCRGMAAPRLSFMLLGAALCGLALLDPAPLLTGAIVFLAVVMVLTAVLNASALIGSLRKTPAPEMAVAADLPTVSVITALYRESGMTIRLIRRLGRIDYPRDRLDVIIALEQDDDATRQALARTALPPWVRVLAVPAGTLKTKPRALNYALPFCRGSIIGVYDAEDAPDAAQMRTVADRFARCGPQVACLQGILDFYNPRRNLLSRAFTVEYAVWFRVVLPGLSRLRLPLPLGGTTLFFRREVLESIGGWDAHNVTEDADLGIRLNRHGYRTEIIPTVTEEEANCHPAAWVRQRSRWTKGYLMTWRVHMRRPRQLWRDLGAWGFVAFNVLFLAATVQALLFPLTLMLWALAFGFPDLLQGWSGEGKTTLIAVGLFSEAVRLALVVRGMGVRAKGLPPVSLFVSHLVQPLASLAAFRAMAEMLRRPFYWDKTQHGQAERGVSAVSVHPHPREAASRTPSKYGT